MRISPVGMNPSYSSPTSEKPPLGLPPGSVRAILAILIIGTICTMYALGSKPDERLLVFGGLVMVLYFGQKAGGALVSLIQDQNSGSAVANLGMTALAATRDAHYSGARADDAFKQLEMYRTRDQVAKRPDKYDGEAGSVGTADPGPVAGGIVAQAEAAARDADAADGVSGETPGPQF